MHFKHHSGNSDICCSQNNLHRSKISDEKLTPGIKVEEHTPNISPAQSLVIPLIGNHGTLAISKPVKLHLSKSSILKKSITKNTTTMYKTINDKNSRGSSGLLITLGGLGLIVFGYFLAHSTTLALGALGKILFLTFGVYGFILLCVGLSILIASH